MLTRLLRCVLTCLLRLRYRITVKGYRKILDKGTQGILFMPNHPALIDPVILGTLLYKDFKPYAVIDEDQLHGRLIQFIHKQVRLMPLANVGNYGLKGIDSVQKQLRQCAVCLKSKENILFYPAGRIYRSRLENLQSNRGAKTLLELAPQARVVLVRTTGLWGSSFGRAKGYQDDFDQLIKRHLKHILCNGIFFSPRRHVTIEFEELQEDFPRYAERSVLNRRLEQFYNATAQPNTYVPYTWWEAGGTRQLPEPADTVTPADTSQVPEDTRRKVQDKLRQCSGNMDLKDADRLNIELEMDSLNVVELATWIQQEFSCTVPSPECLRTVADVMLAATGTLTTTQPLQKVPGKWFTKLSSEPLNIPTLTTVTQAFLWHARQYPKRPLLADQRSGVMTYRDMVLATMLLSQEFKRLPGDRIGLLMPATLMTNVTFLATLFAGKTPVMLNWTVGRRALDHAVNSTEIQTILTSQAVIAKLSAQGIDFSGIERHFLFLENLAARFSFLQKLKAYLASRLTWRSLTRAKVPENAVILFTSGSENLPKTVPLTHENLLSDMRGAMEAMGGRQDDILLGMLPPFHSLGVLLNFIVPDCAGLKAAYHPNPMEGDVLAKLVDAYHATVVIGTPAFASGIYRNATRLQLSTLRIVMVGAESCPQHIFDQIMGLTPQVYLLEGYGITECSPVVGVNTPESHKLGSLGHPISCMEWTIRDENLNVVPNGGTGMLYVRGPNVFSGYLNYDGPSPFVEMEGKTWFRTGDLVRIDHDTFMIYQGRLARYVKIGGEMISLPAIEAILCEHLEMNARKTRTLAVENTGDAMQPIITLFTTIPREREEVNKLLAQAGLAPISFIRRIIVIPEIPLMGTGKTDYRTLLEMARSHDGEEMTPEEKEVA